MEEQQPRKVDPSKTTPYVCDCGCEVFTEGHLIRKASKFLTGQSKDQLLPVPILFCVGCKRVIEETVDPNIRPIRDAEKAQDENDEDGADQ